MLVNRRTYVVKMACMEQAVAMLVAATDPESFPYTRRIYSSSIGPFGTLVLEVEYESLAEFEKSWAEYIASTGATTKEKWRSLLESGGMNEIWTMVE